MHAAELARRWPAVRVEPNVLYTDDGQILTSAGASAGLDLCLALLSRPDAGMPRHHATEILEGVPTPVR